MYATRLRAVRISRLRILLGLMLALTFMPWSIGAPLPVHAASRTPNFRIQVIVKSVHIYDDHDWHGAGDIRMEALLQLCPEAPAPCVPGEPGLKSRTLHVHTFDGWTGMTTGLNRILPRATDWAWDGYDLSEDAGYPMYDGERYVLRFEMWDQDKGLGDDHDYMGWVDIWLDKETGYQLRAHQQDAAKGGGTRGDYRLDYEVRLTPLPNLVVSEIERFDVAGSTDSLVCVGVVNAGAEPIGSFPVTLRIDGQIPRDGVMHGGALGPGKFEQVCTTTQLPTAGGRHDWQAIVDETGIIPEMNERDNSVVGVLEIQPGTGSGAVASPAPLASPAPTLTPMPAQTRADLTVSAIKVNGQVPDGKNDCKDGKNSVAVTVKNGGQADAGAFTVRLDVDGDEASVESVDGLEAGTEQEVRFDDVRLKKGEHRLAVSVDAKSAVAESNEDNNERKATAHCQDAN